MSRGNNPLFLPRKAKPIGDFKRDKTEQEVFAKAQKAKAIIKERTDHIAAGGAIYDNGGFESWKDEQGDYHRLHGPARQTEFEVNWYFEGKFHRLDGPAKVENYPHSTRELWYKHGKLHREDGGPAVVEYRKGKLQHEQWFLDDERHREDGPAVINQDGSEEWYFKGKFHREDGPAAIYPNAEGWLWYKNGVPHREGGPALKHQDKYTWYKNGQMHREDGPAYVSNSAEQFWLDGIQFDSLEALQLALAKD